MKKIFSVLIALISVISMAFAFGGCNEEEIEKGFLYTVLQACSMGYITDDEAMSIAYYHNGGVNFSTDITDEDFNPVPKAPKKMSKKTEMSIRQTYLNHNYDGEDYAELSGVEIKRYYGTYSGCVAVMVSDKYREFKQEEWTERISNIRINYSDGNRIFIWKKADEPVEVRGKLYNLEQAYENGYLNEGDLKSVACSYYDCYFWFEENPYSGMYTSTEELTEEKETEIKQAYLEQNFAATDVYRDYVNIYHYYGTYNGNVVVGMESSYIRYDYFTVDKEIGGVLFKDYWEEQFFVYHMN